MKSNIYNLTVIGFTSIALVGCSMDLTTLKQESKTVSAVAQVSLRSVEVTVAGTSSMSESMVFSGRVNPSRQANIVASMGGKVLECPFDVGDFVNEGDPMFIVDTSDLVDNMKNLNANYALAELNFRNAEKIYNNNVMLYDEGIISKSDMDQIIYSYETNRANLYTLEVQMEILEESLLDATTYSTISGIIASKNIEVGGYATQSSSAYTIVDMSPVRINVGIPEQLINSIRLGQELPVSIKAVSEDIFTGTVAMINPLMDNSGTYTIGVDVENPENLIKSGMLADVSFLIYDTGATIVIPVNAILTKGDKTYVYELHGNTVKETEVSTGMEDGELIEITSGLSSGSSVVTKGQTYLSDGESVNISKTIQLDLPEVIEGEVIGNDIDDEIENENLENQEDSEDSENQEDLENPENPENPEENSDLEPVTPIVVIQEIQENDDTIENIVDENKENNSEENTQENSEENDKIYDYVSLEDILAMELPEYDSTFVSAPLSQELPIIEIPIILETPVFEMPALEEWITEEIKDIPDIPDVPDVPEIPDIADIPNVSDKPEISDKPESQEIIDIDEVINQITTEIENEFNNGYGSDFGTDDLGIEYTDTIVGIIPNDEDEVSQDSIIVTD